MTKPKKSDISRCRILEFATFCSESELQARIKARADELKQSGQHILQRGSQRRRAEEPRRFSRYQITIDPSIEQARLESALRAVGLKLDAVKREIRRA